MIKRRIGLFLFFLAAASAAHAFFGRDKIESLWPSAPVQMDARDGAWAVQPVIEQRGMSFRAMNDASNLYLLLRATNDYGRQLLSGGYRQTVTLWFLKPAHTAKAWGIHFDYRHVQPAPGTDAQTLSALGVIVQQVQAQGPVVSTAPLSGEIDLEADLSNQQGRQPTYEIKIPLTLLAQERNGKQIYFDFDSSVVSGEIKRRVLTSHPRPVLADTTTPTSSSTARGESGEHHGGGDVSPDDIFNLYAALQPFKLHFTIHLAKAP